jgi:MFS transporter, ACS family, tartrate transporter
VQSDDRLFRKVARHLLPLLCVAWVVCILDRLNLSFAALKLNADLGLSASAYGFGAGLYFLGYLLFEVPSNLLLARLGARRWIGRILLSWGVVSMGMALVQGPVSFYAVRLLLGIAEAGFVPGAIYFVNQWFPQSRVRRPLAILFAFGPVASAIGAPLSTWILNSLGWRWMFVIEALPALAVGLAVYLTLPDLPREAKWLLPQERAELESQLTPVHEPGLASRSAWDVALAPSSLLLCLQYFLITTTSYAIQLWLPLIANDRGFSAAVLPWVVALPYALAAAAMAAYGMLANSAKSPLWHVIAFMSMAAAGFLFGALTDSLAIIIVCFCLVMCGTYLGATAYWTIPRALASGAGAAASIALANACGNLGGFLGGYSIGAVREHFGSFKLALLVAAALSLIAAALTFATAPGSPRPAGPDRARLA